jgi:hypothetical protein
VSNAGRLLGRLGTFRLLDRPRRRRWRRTRRVGDPSLSRRLRGFDLESELIGCVAERLHQAVEALPYRSGLVEPRQDRFNAFDQRAGQFRDPSLLRCDKTICLPPRQLDLLLGFGTSVLEHPVGLPLDCVENRRDAPR